MPASQQPPQSQGQPPYVVLMPAGGGARLAIHDRRLARLLVYLATKGRRWRLEDEVRGKVHLSYDGQTIRCWRDIDEAPEPEWPA